MSIWGTLWLFLLAVFCGAVVGMIVLVLIVLWLFAKDMHKKGGYDPYDPRT